MKNNKYSIISFSFLISTLFLGIILLISSCKKTNYKPGALQVSFEVDTFLFDTVFTEQGSSTRVLKIFNTSKEDIEIEHIALKKGNSSPFSLNIEGEMGKSAKNIKILAQDSTYIFLRVFIDPTDDNNPFLISDELLIQSADGSNTLPILAYGQNAVYIKDSVLQSYSWTDEKAYIIMTIALVSVGETLTINAGTMIYMHADSRLFVTGTLKIQGSLEHPVQFEGDRIDRKVWVGSYEDIPGEWGGIYFSKTSYNNEINYAIIKNGGNSTKLGESLVMAASIQVDQDTMQTSNPKLKLTNTIIKNSLGYGVLGFNSSIYMDNCVIVQCGAENVMFFEGGNYKVYNSTIATHPGRFMQATDAFSMVMLNYFPINDQEYTSAPLQAEIVNTIIDGHNEDEVLFLERPGASSNVNISYSLYKSSENLEDFVVQNENIRNKNPKFNDWEEEDFTLKSDSPAKNKGINIGLSEDILGNLRTAPVTIGAYQ